MVLMELETTSLMNLDFFTFFKFRVMRLVFSVKVFPMFVTTHFKFLEKFVLSIDSADPL